MRHMSMVAVSGGFDPLHEGHIRMFKAARRMGSILIVILNRDEFLVKKKGRAYQNYAERKAAILEVPAVDYVVQCIDKDMTVCKTLESIHPNTFANGGDRKAVGDLPEADICDKLGINMVFNVGGGKIESSSRLNKLQDTEERVLKCVK